MPTTVVNLKGHRGDPDYADVVYVGRAMHRGGWHLPGSPLAEVIAADAPFGTIEKSALDRYGTRALEAAGVLLTRVPKWSALKAWGMGSARPRLPSRASWL